MAKTASVYSAYLHLVKNKLLASLGRMVWESQRRLICYPVLFVLHEPSIVIIELGGNDGLRAYPIKQMRNNLATMTEASLAQGAKVLLLAAEAPPNLGRRYTTLFRESYSQLANGDNVVALPFIVESIFLSSELMQSDRTHPNASAQPLLLDVVWPTLSSLLGSSDHE